MIDLDFKLTVRGGWPVHHGFQVYSALCRELPWLHEAEGLGVFNLSGKPDENGCLNANKATSLRIRVAEGHLASCMQLIGAELRLGQTRFQIGPPQVFPLVPAAALEASTVLIKVATKAEGPTAASSLTLDEFLDASRRGLATIGVQGEVGVPTIQRGPRAGQARRRVLKFKGKTIPGYGLKVWGMTPEDSIRLQEEGLGGRRKMGCGLFLPVRD